MIKVGIWIRIEIRRIHEKHLIEWVWGTDIASGRDNEILKRIERLWDKEQVRLMEEGYGYCWSDQNIIILTVLGGKTGAVQGLSKVDNKATAGALFKLKSSRAGLFPMHGY